MNVIYSFFHIFKYKLYRLGGALLTLIRLKANGVVFMSYRIIGSPLISVSGKRGRIILGNNIQMNNGLLSNRIGYNCPCILRAEDGAIMIGENVGLSQTTMVAKGADIVVGNNVKIGGGVKIYTSDFHSLDYLSRRDNKLDIAGRQCKSVKIGDDCFIGAGSLILKGVSIGERSVVGAGSVVTKDIPSDVIAGGVPCRIIKKNKS